MIYMPTIVPAVSSSTTISLGHDCSCRAQIDSWPALHRLRSGFVVVFRVSLVVVFHDRDENFFDCRITFTGKEGKEAMQTANIEDHFPRSEILVCFYVSFN